ncbi:MAG: ATP-dependent DNA helicase [Thaumarchaeota archaeon]|nr:ATP-dependent DNA helicase [Nitrososphaerota archaeon]
MTTEEFFSKSGPLAAQFPSYEARSEQLAMAIAVKEAAKTGNNLLVEAGTGVGKSVGYLAPIIQIIEDNRTVRQVVSLPSGETQQVERPRRVVVATGTINLQKQLDQKELPLLKKIYPWLAYSMSVGSENYLCGARARRSLGDAARNPELLTEVSDLERLDKWSQTTLTGVRMDLEEPVSNAAWSAVNRQADLCRCKEWDPQIPCFYRKAKEQARASNVLLVNHHLLMMHLTSEFPVLPDFDYLVIDEIHSLEDVASQCFGAEISNQRVTRLAKDAARAVKAEGVFRGGEVEELFDMVQRSADVLFSSLKTRVEQEKKDSVRLRSPLQTVDTLTNVAMLEHLKKAADVMADAAGAVDDAQKKHEMKALAKRTSKLGEEMRSWLLQLAPDDVYQIVSENFGKRIIAKSNPIDVSDQLRKCLWSSYARPTVEEAASGLPGSRIPVIGASATISTSGTMKFVKSKLGAADAAELVLASPFKYENNAMIYVAHDLPEAKLDGFNEVTDGPAVNRIRELLEISGGRAMILCTSNKTMKFLGARLRPMLPDLRIMIQNEPGGPERHKMIEELKANRKAVIIGVASFWQGVDVPGDALQLVIVTKLPFPNVGDPLFEARCERLDAVRPGTFRSFNLLSIPEMTIKLKQGFGRLIRTSTDWGVVAILDPRIITKRYGGGIQVSLLGAYPGTQVKYLTSEVAEFFKARKTVEAPEQALESQIHADTSFAVEDDVDPVPF